MTTLRRAPVQTNASLMFDARKKISGANNHDGEQLLAAYTAAVVAVNHKRAQVDAMEFLQRTEQALYEFVYPQSKGGGRYAMVARCP